MKHNQFITQIKEYDEAERTITMVGSTETADRVGDIVKMAGVDLSNYKKNLPLIIVPDIHGRTYFLKNILDFVPPDGFLFPELTGKTVFEALEKKSVRIVSVGDALHSELRGRNR